MSNIFDGIKLDVDSNIKKVMKSFKHFDLDKRDEALAAMGSPCYFILYLLFYFRFGIA